MRRTSALAATAITALLLTACTDGAGTSPDGSGASGQDEGPGNDAGPPAAVPQTPATEECVLGTWQLDLATMQADLQELLAGGAGSGVEVDVAGSTTYEFAAGGRFGATVESSSSIAMSADGDELTSTSTSAGELTGTWTLVDGVLTIADVDPTDLAVTTTATLDDEPLDVPAGSAEDAIEALPPTSSDAACDDGALALVTTLPGDEGDDPVSITYVLRR